jgi:hypothetical protein
VILLLATAIVIQGLWDLLIRDLSSVSPFALSFSKQSARQEGEEGEEDLHILIPVPSHNIPNTPPPAALNGSPKELFEGDTIPHPVPPGFSARYHWTGEGHT